MKLKYFTLIVLLSLSLNGCDCNDPISPIINPQPHYKPMWPQAGYNGRHTGNRNTPFAHIPSVNGGTIDWIDTINPQSSFGDGTEASIDSKGNIYHLSTRHTPKGQVIKFRPDGSIIWQQDSLYIDGYFGIALSSDETKIYYRDFYHICCRDSSGNAVWQIDAFGISTFPAIGNDGTIYISYNNHLCAISPSGTVKWTAQYHSGSIIWPALDLEGNIYVCGIDNIGDYEILKISKDGDLLWKHPNLHQNNAAMFFPVIDGFNNIYFKGNDSLISVKKDGEFRWSKKVPASYNTPAITSDNKIIIDSVYSIISLDTAGNILWVNKQLQGPRIEPYIVLDDENNIYFNYSSANTSFSIASIDMNGNLRWNIEQPVGGNVLPGLTLSPLGRIFDTPKRPKVVFYIK